MNTLNNLTYTLINKFAQAIKGKSYKLDQSIPLASLISLSTYRFVCYLRCFRYGISPRKKGFFGKHLTLKNRKFIRFGYGITLGRSVYIDGLSTEGVTLGNNVSIGDYSRIEASGTITDIGKCITIGNNSGIGQFSFIGGAGGVTIGNDVIMGQYVSFHPENHNFHRTDIAIRKQGVNREGITVGDDCWVGAKVTFLDGSRVGKGCVIAAGSVVRGEIPPYSVVAGIPARIIKYRKHE